MVVLQVLRRSLGGLFTPPPVLVVELFLFYFCMLISGFHFCDGCIVRLFVLGPFWFGFQWMDLPSHRLYPAVCLFVLWLCVRVVLCQGSRVESV